MDLIENVVRQFFAGKSLESIHKETGEEKKTILEILRDNPATSATLTKEWEAYRDRGYTPFFYSSKAGRPTLPEKRKRKVRQIRISDDEMEILGNPTTSRMRETLIYVSKLREFMRYLDSKGVVIIPEEILHDTLNPNDPFWQGQVYGSNFNVMKNVVESRYLWERVAEMMGDLGEEGVSR
ncbi:hypothetical protein [Paenibacillus xylanilyticus]|uniref:hypothetical protein n=1 Tax=Paenibacillus xylanilyticus TaxID=248903 RepID=UPI00129D45BF|nr:hypothetical protein [Paenibacillus xylanilyticus]